MNFWTPDNLKAAVSGTFTARPEGLDLSSLGGVTIDSRAFKPGQVFVAIKGDRFDGHDFVIDAVAAGAQVVIVERDPGPLLRPAFVIKVPSTRKALLRLAAAYRDALTRTRVVAICGSNGKTTTTALINAVLSTRFRGSASAKSFNNDIGVPLTILSAKTADQFLLCEVGTNAPGEIAALAAVVRPDLAVITSIGREHLLGFGSIEGVAREEAAVLQHLRPAEPGAPSAIVTADSPALTEHLRSLPGLLTFGRHGSADLRLTAFEHFCSTGAGVPDSIRFSVNARAAFSAPLIGEHNAVNALAAIAVARRFGLSDAEIARGLAAATPPEMRLATVEAAGIRIVNDAYNANPDSTLAALRTFAAIHAAADRRVVVLGDNLELGDHAPAAHREIGETILELGCIDLLITVGPLAALAAAALEHDWPPHRLHRFETLDDKTAPALTALLRPGDALLLKGSRRMALERIVRRLRDTAPTPTIPGPSAPTFAQ